MTVKEYLNQVRVLDLKINQKIEEKEMLMHLATGTGSQDIKSDRVQTSIDLHKTEAVIAKYVDLETEITRMIDQYVDLRDKIINEIHQLTDIRYVDVLHQRYVLGHSFELIAVNMNYSIRRVYQLHGDALQEFAHSVSFNCM